METSITKPDSSNETKSTEKSFFGSFTIGAKLTLTFIMIFCFTIVTSGWVNYNISSGSRESLLFSQLNTVTAAVGGDLADLFESQQSRTAGYATDFYIRNEVEKLVRPVSELSPSQEAEAKRALISYLKSQKLILYNEMVYADLIDTKGEVIASTTDASHSAHLIYPSLVPEVLTADYGSAVYAGYHKVNANGIGYIVYIAPLYGLQFKAEPIAFLALHFNNEKRVQTIIASVGKSNRSELSNYISPDSQFEAYLVDKKGSIIANSRYSPKQLSNFKLKDFPLQNCQSKLLQIRGVYENYHKDRVLGASACLLDGWNFVVEVPEELLFKDLRQLFTSLINSSAIILIVTMMISYYVVQRIVGPIKKFVVASGKLSQGDLSARAEITHSGDELAELGFVFNDMATKLESLYRNLENKVRERTWDLQKFKLAVENAAEHIIITDENAHIIYANKAATIVTGYSFEEMNGKTPRLWGGNMSPDFYKNFWHVIKEEKKQFNGEIKNTRKDGTNYDALSHISPVLDEQNNVIFFVGIEQDITKLKEVDRMKTEFVSLASHQLRTPLTAIKWYLEMLLAEHEGALNSAQRELAQNVNQSNERMITLVNALLNVSRLESGRLSIEPKDTDLEALVNDIIEELRPELDKRHLRLTFNIQSDIKFIKVDSKLLQNVYMNFLTNSIKYSNDSGHIYLDISRDDGMVKSVIRDEGCGIVLSEQQHIYEKFFRGTNAVKIAPSGTGLGLYFAKGIIEALGGKLWFESVVNKGTTFTFVIPSENPVHKAGEVTVA